MVLFPMTLCDPERRFQGYNIFQRAIFQVRSAKTVIDRAILSVAYAL